MDSNQILLFNLKQAPTYQRSVSILVYPVWNVGSYDCFYSVKKILIKENFSNSEE